MNPNLFRPMTPQPPHSLLASSSAATASTPSGSEVREQTAAERDPVAMEEVDPTGLMRALGEFFQTFAARPHPDASR